MRGSRGLQCSRKCVAIRAHHACRDVALAATAADVAVIGAGAAGLTAAYFCAAVGGGARRVTLLERKSEGGKKILMSGGTRCNVLPAEASADDYYGAGSASAMRALLSSWSLGRCREWLERDVGIRMALEPGTGKLFPVSNSGREVRDRLVAACARRGVEVRYGASVEGLEALSPAPDGGGGGGGGWRCRLADGGVHDASRVVLATGGLSFPAVGTDGTGHRLLRGLGAPLVETYPALTPLKGRHPGGEQLPGLSLGEVRLRVVGSGGGAKRARDEARRHGFLFTHKGYSGPAVLDVSHHMVLALEGRGGPSPELRANWTGEGRAEWDQRLQQGGPALVRNALCKAGLKERLAAALCADLGLSDRTLAQLKRGERERLVDALTAWPLHVDAHEGYRKAEVTGGGVPLSALDCRTMQLVGMPGLHVCGELLEPFGRIGGFNFYLAWLTGRLAGLGAAGAAAAPGGGRGSKRRAGEAAVSPPG